MKCKQKSSSYFLDRAFLCPGINFVFLSKQHISLAADPKLFNANMDFTIDVYGPWMKP